MIEPSPKRNIIFSFLFWQFIAMPKKILKGWENFLLFCLNYFSVPQLLKTLFSHWRRMKDSYGRSFDPKVYLNAFVGNVISRVIGAIIRTVIIIVGLVFTGIALIGGAMVLVFWIFLPVFLVTGFFISVELLI